MKADDKFLVAIVGGILLVVAVTFVAVLRRPPPTFTEENTAASVAHNYLLALRQQDYVRAYGYLSPSLKGYPSSAEAFVENIRSHKYSVAVDDDSVTLEIDSSRRLGMVIETEAVSVRETHFYGGGLLNSNQYSSSFEMELQRENGAWKIISSDRYFIQCWTDKTGCK